MAPCAKSRIQRCVDISHIETQVLIEWTEWLIANKCDALVEIMAENPTVCYGVFADLMAPFTTVCPCSSGTRPVSISIVI